MKATRRQISSTDFVLRLLPSYKIETARQKLESLGTVEPVTGHSCLYLVHLAKAAASPRKGWQRIRQALGGNVEVTPVFLEPDQSPKFAAGTLQVRFPTPPTDAELQEWLPSGLRLKSRNQYVPSQVALEPDDPTEHYLPDLLAALEKQSDQDIKIWPETLQQFRRG